MRFPSFLQALTEANVSLHTKFEDDFKDLEAETKKAYNDLSDKEANPTMVRKAAIWLKYNIGENIIFRYFLVMVAYPFLSKRMSTIGEAKKTPNVSQQLERYEVVDDEEFDDEDDDE